EENIEAARRLRERFEAGELRALAPPLLWLEVLNVAARRWGWDEDRLEQLATSMPELGFEMLEPELSDIARWSASGLTAYDASYVAVAERAGVELITDDAEIVRVAPELAIALAGR
ncbi:MAG TPA: type II toxin-antitoxin system VapC family toxin, partial [Blastocatellia bacterium]|nr:type II toxin-antitoxin system VapC family toxin [Blastocatellia bacterium]